MTSIDIDSAREAGSIRPFGRARPSWMGRAASFRSAIARKLDARRAPSRLLRLDDRLLRDIGETRGDLELQAMFWPFRAPGSKSED